MKGVRTAIKEAGVTKSAQDVVNLRQDIKNAPDHVFGNHNRCREFCNRKENHEQDDTKKVDPLFFGKIRTLVGNVESKADSLVYNQTTNVAERYMGYVAKFTGGKRINFSTGGSFQRRCVGAGLAHSTGPSWHLSPWKRLQNRSPGSVFKKKILSREKRNLKRKLQFAANPPTKRRRSATGNADRHYGPLAVEADADEDVLRKKSEDIIEKLKLEIESAGGFAELQMQTVGQQTNKLWAEARMNRLTASKFGVVIKRLPHTPCHNLVKTILYPRPINTEAVTFGRDNEMKVIEMYQERTGKTVKPCGLFVDQQNVFLGASPDGLVDDDKIIEVKCLHSVSERSLQEELVQNKKKSICLEMNKKGSLQLKRQHVYYFQVQGQLNICKRQWCDFIVYTKKGELFVETIQRDAHLWETFMLPKLVLFYNTCILPELADSRIVRGLKVRDPPHIVRAIEKRGEKVNKKGGKSNDSQ